MLSNIILEQHRWRSLPEVIDVSYLWTCRSVILSSGKYSDRFLGFALKTGFKIVRGYL
jgi:hypothetical protein